LKKKVEALHNAHDAARLMSQVFERRASMVSDKLALQTQILSLLVEDGFGDDTSDVFGAGGPTEEEYDAVAAAGAASGNVLWSPRRHPGALQVDASGAKQTVRELLVRADVIAARQRALIGRLERDVKAQQSVEKARRLVDSLSPGSRRAM
jgi:hypothetical protein